MRRITGGTRHAAKSMPIAQMPEFFTKLDNDAYSKRSDLPDFIRTLFGLGSRVGETLALTWQYINLSDEPIERTAFDEVRTIPPRSLWICATITEPKRQGPTYGPVKTTRSNRIVGIPDFLYLVFVMRKTSDVDETEPVFLCSGTKYQWRRPKAISKAIKLMRKRLDIPDFLSHSGRKTAATVLYRAHHSSHDVADQFGHVDGDFTRTHYVDPGVANPETARTLDRAYSSTR
ncbi:tyrosine-type recombinase/integrase [Amycolatopsis sp. WAC 04182]|uniref:tyrosine-type recombinase/integrase n=1 Tax=Amycolatopsis sp. WAC 04182 TaxID=2203198 RepID=UPI0035195FC5